jgi:hypothetical protein
MAQLSSLAKKCINEITHIFYQFQYLTTSIFFGHIFERGEEGTKPGE